MQEGGAMKTTMSNRRLALRAAMIGFALELPLLTCFLLAIRYTGRDSGLTIVLYALHFIPSFIVYVLQSLTAGPAGHTSPFGSLPVSSLLVYLIQSVLLSSLFFIVLKTRNNRGLTESDTLGT